MRDIGKNICAMRRARGMTQDELAARLFVTRQTVSNYETGRSRPDVEMLEQIAQAMGAEVTDVLYGVPAENRRRKANAVRLAAGVGIWLALCALVAALRPWVQTAAELRYVTFPAALLGVFSVTFLWVPAGWCAVQALCAAGAVKPLAPSRRVRIVRRTLAALCAAEALSVLLAAAWIVLTNGGSPAPVPVRGMMQALRVPAVSASAHAALGAALCAAGFPSGAKNGFAS